MFPLLFIQIRRKDFPQQNKQNREISSYNWGNLILYQVGVGESASAVEDVLLHGDLLLTVIEACRLPNMDYFSEHLRRCYTSCCPPIPGSTASKSGSDATQHHQNHHHRKIITSDPYVTASLAGATVARTRVISNSEDPAWNEHFNIPVAHRASTLELQVKDNDVFGAQLIGIVSIPTARIAAGKKIQDWFPIIAGDPEQLGVRNTYFPLRKGGSVTLYQDAHVLDDELPEVTLEKGAVFKHEKCWEDICHAILEAHHLIYLVGWSIYHKVKLVREPTRPLPDAGKLTLGDLLKYKSQEGVRVCMLVWDDKTSHDKLFIKTGGVMQTHDEETKKFFKHSSVICVLSPRYASSKLSIIISSSISPSEIVLILLIIVVGTLFTHHQKCVLVDTQASGNMRKITAFIGGLDLCDGRYDTPEHRLFRDLDTTFLNDFHNPTFAAGIKAPRQPWHDLHCKIEGPAVYDILKNFEQRWRKATRWQEFSLYDDPSLWVSQQEDSEQWHVQVFRSIDSGSVKGFPDNVQEASKMNLVCRKNLVIDKSIHTAYVKAIRSAQHFIYIENQYFLGSSYGWPSYKHSGADNLIPMELALKVASKIRANEPFAVYVVIPMWPEGVPTTNAVQEILFWQVLFYFS
uniref:phospholipase D n=1 Tax=Musa acuminata subsp. malaccensis TaxID=214687 RepID=A0A804KLZ8_MUSAM